MTLGSGSGFEAQPLISLATGRWCKLICGASLQDLPLIRNLALVYTLAGVDCIDVAADPAVVAAAAAGREVALGLGAPQKPWLMVSLNDGEDPHFRKAAFDPQHCPVDCLRPCERICPTQAIGRPGVDVPRCYGCGRCLGVCPWGLIGAQTYVHTPAAIVDLLANSPVDALELHTQVGHADAFSQVWQQLQPWAAGRQALAISCPGGEGLQAYLTSIYAQVRASGLPLIWQTDGRPMSGDVGRGTTTAAIRLGATVLGYNLPGYVQLAGGTNAETVPRLRSLGFLADSPQPRPRRIAGVAYGSYARKLVQPYLESAGRHLETNPTQLKEAVEVARELISPLKGTGINNRT
ncbi:MAG: 4Fe-4S ferredoxin [Gloeomargaritaceae cyanobacterium C42_A2020_066]|nr:4Fe-4S ferredoxin [Gloeomargaritaceae cyanobacterium C42_A2020_066]